MARALAIVANIGVLLAVDTQVVAGLQLVLGGGTWLALALACRSVSPALRVQTLVVVVVATCGEIVGSIVWGVYTYRLENLPSFVPPAHGLVYLGGAALARKACVSETQSLLGSTRPPAAHLDSTRWRPRFPSPNGPADPNG